MKTICVGCKQPITGEKFFIPAHIPRNHPDWKPYWPACEDCYAAYVKAKYGAGNANPDEIAIA